MRICVIQPHTVPMKTQFRPLLASNLEDTSSLKFPVMVSPKLDGIRCVIQFGEALTRTLLPIPNKYIRAQLANLPPFDGELVVGDPARPDTWNTSTTAIMSHEGEPAFTFHVFDYINSSMRFLDRLEFVKRRAPMYGLLPVGHYWVRSESELISYESQFVNQGYEGLMLRDPDGRYKFGRSTVKEAILLKMKRFDDLEARVHGVKERMKFIGEGGTNELGLSKRGYKKEDKEAAGDLGALICQIALSSGTECVEFDCGTGFTAEQRRDLWQWAKTNTAYDPIGKMVKIKHQGFTPDGKPRFPVFLGFRDEKDIG